MPLARPSAVLAVLAVATSGCLSALWEKHRPPPPAPPPAVPAALGAAIKLELVTRETTEAVALVAAPEPPGRLFVVEKRGPIRILRGNRLDPKPFYDLTGKVSLWRGDNGEQGLLGLAFHPQFAQNGRLYINYTDLEGDTRVVELRVDAKDPNRAVPASAREILHVEQPYDNHNAGDLAFGPDGQLHVLLGDGGKADDPHGHGQNPKSLLSKMLRIDVDASTPAVTTYGRGMRNPWRISFDRQTGDLYIADVGQNVWEWVHVIPAARLAGPHNLGWNITEGSNCFRAKTCNKADLTPPVVEYPHSEGCSITGGHVYRGKALPELDGHYFYSDYCTALLRSFRYQDGRATDHWDWKAALDPEAQLARVAAFGQDHEGELHIVTHEGPIYKLTRR
jgi:glucose/arabinose dehydrogenase